MTGSRTNDLGWQQVNPGTIAAMLDPQVFAYETGIHLRGYSVSRRDGEWQVIFRGTTRAGKKVYCLYVAVDLGDALGGLFDAVTGKGGSRYWYPDKYAK